MGPQHAARAPNYPVELRGEEWIEYVREAQTDAAEKPRDGAE